MMWTRHNRRWTKPAAGMVAWLFSLAQLVPVAEASQYLRGAASDRAAGVEARIAGDLARLGGADLAALLGPTNLRALAADALASAGVFPLLGPRARPTDVMVEEYAAGYAQRYGIPLSPAEQSDLRGRLERVRNVIWQAREGGAAGFTVVLDETGRLDLRSDGPDRQALLSLGAGTAYVNLEDIEALALGVTDAPTRGEQELYRRALGMLLRHRAAEAAEGRFLRDAEDNRAFLRTALEGTSAFPSVKEMREADQEWRTRLRQARQDAARHRAEALKREPITITLANVGADRLRVVQVALDREVESGALSSATAAVDGGKLLLTAQPGTLPRDQAQAHLIRVAYEAVSAFPAGYRGAPGGQWVGESPEDDEGRPSPSPATLEHQQAFLDIFSGVVADGATTVTFLPPDTSRFAQVTLVGPAAGRVADQAWQRLGIRSTPVSDTAAGPTVILYPEAPLAEQMRVIVERAATLGRGEQLLEWAAEAFPGLTLTPIEAADDAQALRNGEGGVVLLNGARWADAREASRGQAEDPSAPWDALLGRLMRVLNEGLRVRYPRASADEFAAVRRLLREVLGEAIDNADAWGNRHEAGRRIVLVWLFSDYGLELHVIDEAAGQADVDVSGPSLVPGSKPLPPGGYGGGRAGLEFIREQGFVPSVRAVVHNGRRIGTDVILRRHIKQRPAEPGDLPGLDLIEQAGVPPYVSPVDQARSAILPLVREEHRAEAGTVIDQVAGGQLWFLSAGTQLGSWLLDPASGSGLVAAALRTLNDSRLRNESQPPSEAASEPPMPALVWAESADALRIGELGGKVSNSAKMLQAGLDVPNFFAMTNTALQQFHAANPGILERARELVLGVDADDEVSAGDVERQIKGAIANGTIPADLQEQLEASFRELARREGYGEDEIDQFLVAIRSSARMEDLPGVPAAGIQDSNTNVALRTLFENVLDIWGSLFNRRAIAYRDKTAFFMWLKRIDRRRLDLVADLLERALDHGPDRVAQETMAIPGRSLPIPRERLISRLRRIAGAEDAGKLKLDEVYLSTKQLLTIFQRIADFTAMDPEAQRFAAAILPGLEAALRTEIDQFVDPRNVGMSALVQVMRPSEVSIVSFSVNKPSGWTGMVNGLDVVVFEASYGLGEYVVEGKVNPDMFIVARRATPDGGFEYVILDKMLGTKEKKLIRDPATGGEIEVPVPQEDRHRFTLTDEQVLEAARKTFEARRVLNQGRAGQSREEPVDTEAVWYRSKAGALTYNIVQMRDVQLFRGFDFQSPELMQIVRSVIPPDVKRRAIQEGLSVAKGFPTSGAAVGTTVWVEDVKVEDVRAALERIADGVEGAEAIRAVVPAEHADLFTDEELSGMVSRARTERRFATSGAVEWAQGLSLDGVRALREAGQSADVGSALARVAEAPLRRIVQSFYEAAPQDAGLRDRLLLTLYRAVVEGKTLGGELLHEQAAGLAALILNKQFAKVQKLVDAGQDVILFAPETNPNYNEMMAKVKGTLTLQGGETSHAIVIAGQWGYSVVGGAVFDEAALRRTPDLVERLRRGAEVTVDANDGSVFLGRLPLEEESLTYPVTRWEEYGGKVGLIAAAPVELERATKLAQYPGHYGVNLTRVEDWLIAEIGTNFRAARAYDRLAALKAGTLREDGLSVQQLADVRKMEGSPDEQEKIAAKIVGYSSAEAFVRFKLRSLILREMATLTPKQVVQVRAMDFKKNESRDRQAGARLYFNEEPASMIGDRGTGLEVRDENLEGLDLQLLAISDAKQDAQRLGGLGKVGFMLVFIRRTKDLQAALDRMEQLYREGTIVLPDEVGVMFELTINAVLADRFAKILADWRDHMKRAYGADLVTYFSHGTNDQTQSVLGDRDERRYQRTQVYLPGAPEPVDVRVFDEGDPAVIANVLHGTAAAKRNGIKCGLCGQAMVNLVNRGTPEALTAAAKIAVHLDSVGTDVKTYGRTVKLRAEAQLAAQSVEQPVAERAQVLLGGASVGTGAATRRVVIAERPADLSYQVGERTVSRVVEGDILVLTPEIVEGDPASQPAVLAAIDRASGVIFSGAHVQDGIVSAALARRKPTIVTASPIYREPEGGSDALRIGSLEDGKRYTVDFARGQVYAADTPVVAAPMTDDTAYERIDWNAAPEALPAARVGMDDVYQALGIHPLALMTYAFLKHEITDPVSRGKIEKLLSEQEISSEAQQRVAEKVAALLERRGVRSVGGLLEQTLRELLLEKAQSLPDGTALIVETSQADANAFRRLDEGETFELATANAPIAFRGLLKTISPGYDEVFLMFLTGFRNLFFADPQLKRRDLRLQLDYVQTPKVLELALAFLKARQLAPGEHHFEVGMNIATSANFINAEEFLRQGIRFMTIEPRLLLMNLALADPDNEVLLYDGSLQPLVDPQEPEFQEALGIASQMAKTAAAKHGVKLVEDPRPSGAVFTVTVQGPMAVEHALLGFVPAPLEGLSYAEQTLQVWPGYELSVRRGETVVASYTGAIRESQNLQAGDTLVLQPLVGRVTRPAADLPDLTALRPPLREQPPAPFERRVQLGGADYAVTYAGASHKTAEEVAALILNNEKRFAQGVDVGEFEERLIARGRENPAWFISYVRRVLEENPYSLVARDAQGRIQGIVFVSLTDAKSAEQLPDRHARMRHAHQAKGMRSSLTFFWLAPAVPGMADELFLSTQHLVHHLNQAQPETCRIEHLFAYSAPRGYKAIAEAHMMWGGPLSIDAYLAFGDDPVVHKFLGRHGGKVVRVIPRAWSHRHSGLGYAVVVEHPLASQAPKAPSAAPSAEPRPSSKSRWIFTLFGQNDGVLAPDVIQAFAGQGLFGDDAGTPNDYGPFGTPGAWREPTFEELVSQMAVPEANQGNAIVSLLGLVDLQWLTVLPSGDLQDERTRYGLTALGRAALDLIRLGAYRETASASRHLVNLHHYLYGSPLPMRIGDDGGLPHQRALAITPGSREAALEAYRGLIASARAGWGLPPDNALDATRRRAADQVRTHLNGALLVSTLIALWRPDARPQAAGVLEEFVEPSTGRSDRSIRLQLLNRGSVSLGQLAQAYDPEFLGAAFELFEHQGYVTRAGDAITLTPAGRFFFDKAGRYGVTHSYLKSYAVAGQLFWGNPDPWGIEEDFQLDREEDVEASRQTHPTYIPYVHRHIKAAFDRPAEAQQAGLMVLGIGAGSLAASDILYIVNETERGQHLATHPLYFVGVDLSPISLKEAERTLRRELAGLESQGIRVVFVEEGSDTPAPDGTPAVYVVLQRGDINLPGRVDEDLHARGIPLGEGRVLAVSDLIPLHEFGPHDRGVAVHVQTRERALQVIREGVRYANREHLKAVLGELRQLGALGLVSDVPEEIPDDEDALVALVARQFTTPFSQKGRLVPAVVGGADLIEYFRGWRSVTDYFMALDLHRRRPRAIEEEVPEDPDAAMDYQHSALAAYQWSQGLTQTMMPYLEHKLAAVLGGWSMQDPVQKPNEDFAIVSMASYVASNAPSAEQVGDARPAGEPARTIQVPVDREQTVGEALQARFGAVMSLPGTPLTAVLDHGGEPVSYAVELITEEGPFPLGTTSIPVEIGDVLQLTRTGSEEPAAARGPDETPDAAVEAALDPELLLSEVPLALLDEVAKNALRYAGFRTIGDFRDRPIEDLHRIRNIGSERLSGIARLRLGIGAAPWTLGASRPSSVSLAAWREVNAAEVSALAVGAQPADPYVRGFRDGAAGRAVPQGAGPQEDAYLRGWQDGIEADGMEPAVRSAGVATLDDVGVAGKTVLIRPDLNVPVEGGRIKDPEHPHARMVASADTIRELAEKGAKVVVIFHQGRPGDPDFLETADQHAEQLSRLIGRPVQPVDDLFGAAAQEAIRALQPGQVVLLKPVRATDPSTGNALEASPNFVGQLTPLVDLFVLDGFSVAHRDSPSVTGFTGVPAVAGRLMRRELEGASQLLAPAQPHLLVVGGGKVPEKLTELESSLESGKAAHVLMGGRLAFLALIAVQPGASEALTADAQYALAVATVGRATADDLRAFLSALPRLAGLLARHRDRVELPVDVVGLREGERQVVALVDGRIPEGFDGLLLSGIGPKTSERYAAIAGRSDQPFQSAFVLGPMSDTRYDALLPETRTVVEAVAGLPFWSTGGGDTEALVQRLGFAPTYSSLAGGALAEYLSGKTLPGVQLLIARGVVTAKRAGDPDITPEEAAWLKGQLPAWQPTLISREERQAMAGELQVFLGADTVVMDAETRQQHQWLIRALRDGIAPEVTVRRVTHKRGVTHKNVAVHVKIVSPVDPDAPTIELDRIPRDPQTLRLEAAAMRLKRNTAEPNSALLKELLASERRTVSAYTTHEYAENGRDLRSITIHLPRALYTRDYSTVIDRRIHTAVLQDVIHELAESLLGVPHWIAAAKYEPVYGVTPSGTTHRQLRDLLYAALYFDQRYLEQLASAEPYPHDPVRAAVDGAAFEAASSRAGALYQDAQAMLRQLDSAVMALYESWGDQEAHTDALRSALQRMADQLDDDDDLDDLFSIPTNQPVVYAEAAFAQDLADAGYVLGAGTEAKYVRAAPALLALVNFQEPGVGVAVARGKSGTTYRVSMEQLGEGPEVGRITETASGRSERYTFGVFQRRDPVQATAAGEPEEITAALLTRVRGEFGEMPGTRLTTAQAARLFDLSLDTAGRVLEALVAEGFLVQNPDGVFLRGRAAGEPGKGGQSAEVVLGQLEGFRQEDEASTRQLLRAIRANRTEVVGQLEALGAAPDELAALVREAVASSINEALLEVLPEAFMSGAVSLASLAPSVSRETQFVFAQRMLTELGVPFAPDNDQAFIAGLWQTRSFDEAVDYVVGAWTSPAPAQPADGGELAARSQQAAQQVFAIWRRSYDLPPPPDAAGISESLQRVREDRVRPAYEEVVRPLLSEGRRVLVSLHGNSGRALSMELFGITPEEVQDFTFPLGTPVRIHLDGNRRVLGVSVIQAGPRSRDQKNVDALIALLAKKGIPHALTVVQDGQIGNRLDLGDAAASVESELVLVRHGETESSDTQPGGGFFAGWMDVSLTPQGRGDAVASGQALALVLGEGDDRIDAVFSSDLKRSKDTLRAVLEGLGRTDLVPVVEPRLKERHYGALAGKARGPFMDELAGAVRALWAREPALLTADARTLATQLSTRWHQLTAPAQEPLSPDVARGIESAAPRIAELGLTTEQARALLERAYREGLKPAELLAEASRIARENTAAQEPASLLEQIDALGIDGGRELRQVAMLPQVPEMARVTDVSDALITASAQLEQTQWIVLDSSVLKTLSAPIVLDRLRALSNKTLPGGQSAFKFALVFRDADTQEQAEQLAEAYFAAMPEASRNTVGLQRADYLVLPGAGDVDMTLRTLELVHPVRGVLGPSDWAQAMRQNSAAPGQVRAVAMPDASAGKTPATGQALLDLMEGVAADVTQRPLDPAIARRLEAIEGEMPWVQIQDVAAETEQDVRAYEARMESIHAVAIKG